MNTESARVSGGLGPTKARKKEQRPQVIENEKIYLVHMGTNPVVPTKKKRIFEAPPQIHYPFPAQSPTLSLMFYGLIDEYRKEKNRN